MHFHNIQDITVIFLCTLLCLWLYQATKDLDFQLHMSWTLMVFFHVQWWIKVRGDCLLSWYWWNCWSSLFRGYFSFCWYWWNCWSSLFRGYFSFCCYWWNCWSSLFKLSFRNLCICSIQIVLHVLFFLQW